MCIHRYRIFARFGLMHMIATNICVWLRTVAVETVRELNQHAPGHRSNYHTHLGSNKTSTTTTTTTTTQLPPVVYFEMDTSSEGSGYNTLNSSLTGEIPTTADLNPPSKRTLTLTVRGSTSVDRI